MEQAGPPRLINNPRRVVDGFGRAIAVPSLYAAPGSTDELSALLGAATEQRMPVTMRGAGRSYGDAATNDGALVIGTEGLRGILSWDPESGVIDLEAGATIEDVWRHTIADGYWPSVVPGTMFPTMGGCVGMNIHGKNHFKAGCFGDHVLDLDLLTPSGELRRCSREQDAELFHAVVGGMGLLGVTTRVRLRLKKVESGLLKVEGFYTPDLPALFEAFEARLDKSDYLVAWLDGFPKGRGLGRAAVHQANYLPRAEDPRPDRSFSLAEQELPSRIFGVVPRGLVWRVLKLFTNDPGMRLVNLAKSWASRLLDRSGRTYLQSHVAFAFLLDYIPRWREAYAPGGFIQVQSFVPTEAAPVAFERILRLCQERDLVSYLAVFKKHRPDDFLLSHALDGYSLALDFRVTRERRERLWQLGRDIGDIVVDAGGRFYFAKDAVAVAEQIARSFGRERLETFARLKSEVDPQGVLSSDLSRRLFPSLPVISAS